MNLPARVQYILAVIGCIGAIGGPTAGAIIQASDDPPRAGAVSCAVVADRAADFAKEHPEAAQRYAEDPDLRLASEQDIEACGDPERAIAPPPSETADEGARPLMR